jgi:HD-GYP domain-containing protein (c-di-GMP phosphodiesterase class II)
MNTIRLCDIKEGALFTEPVYLDDGFTVSAPETPFSGELLKLLNEWGFAALLTDGTPIKLCTNEDDQALADRFLDDSKTIRAREHYTYFLEFADKTFAKFKNTGRISYGAIADEVKTIYTEIMRDPDYYLSAMGAVRTAPEDFLVEHCCRCVVLAIIIGKQLKFAPSKLIDLGVAAFTHEIGLVHLHENLLGRIEDLPEKVRPIVLRHTIASARFLDEANFPTAIINAVKHHHEKEDGSGYPSKLLGMHTSAAAKILGLCCDMVGLLDGGNGKPPLLPYAAINTVIKNNGILYNQAIVKAAIQGLSIYPVGTKVTLNNGQKALVVGVNPESPLYPFVAILEEKLLDGRSPVRQTTLPEYHIKTVNR